MKSIKKYVGIFLLALCLIGTMQAVPCKAASLNSNVNGIVKSQVLPEDTKEVKLQKLFQYTEKTYGYKRQIGFKNKKGWTKTYAQKMIKSKKGSCYHFAAVYGYLAKKATGYKVRVAVGQTKGFSGSWQPHAWTEVKVKGKWYIFDTNMDKFKANSTLKYYNILKTSKAAKKVYKKKGVKYVNIK